MKRKKYSKYEIINKFSEGATAKVYCTHDTVLGREMALKVLKPPR